MGLNARSVALILVIALIPCLGVVCPFFPAPQQTTGGNGGVVTVQLENRSGVQVAVSARYVLSDNEVRETKRLIEASGHDASATLLPTRTHLLEIRATVSDNANIPPRLLVVPGDVLLEQELHWQEDFRDGETLLIIIHGPDGAPDFIDCNTNGITDSEDIATGFSSDCQPNGVPDECDIGHGPGRGIREASSAAGLLFPLDGGFVPAMAANDDGSSAEIFLGFGFDFYGSTYTSVFINNNGNLSFGSAYAEFTSTGFPVEDFPMIAPFWGDVDTRSDFGTVWYKIVDNTLIVIWENVGYYTNHGDKLNTFEVAISDGSNPIMGEGINVVFCYGDMQWTTGDASDGVGGFGGTPATVGANKGDGTLFFQIGRFDHAGTDYDGPGDAADGVSFLDNQCYSFSTAGAGGNVSPVVVGLPPDGRVLFNPNLGAGLDVEVQFLSPEFGQTTSVVVTDVNNAAGAGFTITSTPGNVASVRITGTTTCAASGLYRLEFAAADDFVPPGTAHAVLEIVVDCHSQDCNSNGVPDECEADCNGNGRPDDCDIIACEEDASCGDCNGNLIPDGCDIDSGHSTDENENGRPDECDILIDVLQAPPSHRKIAPNPGFESAE